MNNERTSTGGERFRCLICSSSSPRLSTTGSSSNHTDKAKEDKKNLYKTSLVLHKLLQIPLWECAQYLISAEVGSGHCITNSLKLCFKCAEMVDQGRSILERVEGLQAQLQTLQATLQNQILSQNPSSHQDNYGGDEDSDEDKSQNKLRDQIRQEIRKNVCRSSLSRRDSGDSDAAGNSHTPNPPAPGSTPVLAEETPAIMEGEDQGQGHIRMEFEVGEVKTEEELGHYEVIDLGSDNEDGANDERGQDLDAMVAEVTIGGIMYDVDQSQLESIQPSWSTQSSPSIRCDMSPLPAPPSRKRMRSSVMQPNNSRPLAAPDSQLTIQRRPSTSDSNSQVQIISQISQQQQQLPSPQPGPSRQYLPPTRTQSLPVPMQATTATQSSVPSHTTLLQMLLNPPSVPSPPPIYTTSSAAAVVAAMQIQPVIHGKQIIWSGILEWHEKNKGTTSAKHEMPCRIHAPAVNHMPTVDSTGWPGKLVMQCIPKPVLSAAGPAILKESKTVLFEFDKPNSPQVGLLTKVLDGGYAGCIHFFGSSAPCAIKLMAIVHVQSRKNFVGIIPDHQNVFVGSLRSVIQTYNKRQMQAAATANNQNQPNISSQSLNNQNNVMIPVNPVSLSSSQNQQVPQLQQQQQQLQFHDFQYPNLQQGQRSSTVHHMPPAPPTSTFNNSNFVTQRQLNLLQIQQLEQNLAQARARQNQMNFQIMQQGNNTVTSFSIQQTDQQQQQHSISGGNNGNFGSFNNINLHPGPNNNG